MAIPASPTSIALHTGWLVQVSGTRLWPWLASKHGGVASLARGAFVHSYCPLAFLAATGRNVTPDKLPAAERHALFPPCDEALRRVTRVLEPRVVLAVGRFAEGTTVALSWAV